MGRFSMNVNVKCTDLASKFTEIMKKNGYEICTEDNASMSYLIAQGKDWATLAGKGYNSDAQKTHADSEFIAKELNTPAFMVEVVDSDWAIIELNGSEVIVGDGSGYGIEDKPAPDKAVWEPLLTNGTFEQLTEIWQTDEVFVEDILAKSAPLFGIDPQLITTDYRDISEMTDGGNISALYFKKIGAGKMMTLNAAFKKVFGEALVPLGFKLIKGRYPYFVRAVPGGEIVHVITLLNDSTNERGKKCFKIFGGIATVYRDEIDLSKSPWTENVNWMRSSADIHNTTDIKYDFAYKGGFREFLFEADNESEMLYELEHSLDVTRKILLHVISKAVDIDSAIECFYQLGMPLSFDERFEGLLFLKAKNYPDIIKKDIKKHNDKYKQKMEQGVNGYTSEEYEKRIQRANGVLQREVSQVENVLNDPQLLAKYTAELERRKAINTEKFRSYGLDM